MTSSGMTRTNKATSFTNGAGSLILSADIAITAEAEEFIAIAGEVFETGLSVDVTLLISDPDYDTFTYSLDVSILNIEPLNLTAGTSGSRVISASVRALYSDGTSEMIRGSDYGITWTTASRDLGTLGMTFTNGVLTVSPSTPAGVYRVPVTATVIFDGVEGTASSVATVTVRDIAPVLSADVTVMTARGRHREYSLTVSRTMRAETA